MPSRATERINFGKIEEITAPPNLIEMQTDSYREFLQTDTAPNKRQNLGLQAVFTEVFPIESYDGKCVLDFHSYEIGEPKLSWLECLREGLTYGAPLYVTFLLKEEEKQQRRKGFHGRTAADDAARHVCRQWRGACHCQPIASVAGYGV